MSQLNNIAISAGSPNRVFNLIEIRLKKRNEKGPTKNDISDTGKTQLSNIHVFRRTLVKANSILAASYVRFNLEKPKGGRDCYV